jgi:hypothetical protein
MSCQIYDCTLCDSLNHCCRKESLLNVSECSRSSMMKKNKLWSSKLD